MLTSVLERTKEIGILRAIGWPRHRVVGMILGESCGLAMVASFRRFVRSTANRIAKSIAGHEGFDNAPC